jgi:hypothetical protein
MNFRKGIKVRNFVSTLVVTFVHFMAKIFKLIECEVSKVPKVVRAFSAVTINRWSEAIP